MSEGSGARWFLNEGSARKTHKVWGPNLCAEKRSGTEEEAWAKKQHS